MYAACVLDIAQCYRFPHVPVALAIVVQGLELIFC